MVSDFRAPSSHWMAKVEHPRRGIAFINIFITKIRNTLLDSFLQGFFSKKDELEIFERE
jgi:hypothetical protein